MNSAGGIARAVRTLTFAAAVTMLGSPRIAAEDAAKWWPASGTVILAGGSLSEATFDEMAKRLIALAGGPDSLIVIIPTANPNNPDDLLHLLESKGAHHVAILRAPDRTSAGSDALVKVLQSAGGVWIPGGRNRQLEETYRGTLVDRELKALLARGGVVAGDSAGALAVGCFSLGWTPDIFGKTADGLCLLPHVTVAPHANQARDFVVADEVLGYLSTHPGTVGIAIDADTVLVLKTANAQVFGQGGVAILDPAKDRKKPVLRLSTGDRHDFSK